jgi:glycosyltransferase involved in cell wall biosynthesis
VLEFLQRIEKGNVFTIDGAESEKYIESMLTLGLVRSIAAPHGRTYEITESGCRFLEEFHELETVVPSGIDSLPKKSVSSEFPLVTVIVPVYNEEETIGDLLSRLVRLEGIRKEIIIVDDGSTDSTPRILGILELADSIMRIAGKVGELKPELTRYNEFPSIKIVRHEGNRGKGAALRTGLVCGNGEILVVQDADLEYLPEDIGMIVHPIVAGEADVVFGSRFLGSCVGMTISHRVGNWILSKMTTLLFSRPVTDVMTGHKAFSRRALHDLAWDEDGFAAEIGIAAAVLSNKELRLTEVPISYVYRLKGSSKIRLRDGLACLLRLMKLRIRAPKRELKEDALAEASRAR